MIPTIKSFLNCDCSGQLFLTNEGYGKFKLVCDRCGRIEYRKIPRKGGRAMPFPKEVRKASDVADEIKGRPLAEFENVELLLNSFRIKTSQAFGELVTMECETKDNEPVKLYTFSSVVVDQCREMHDKLPLIIKPTRVANYFIIY